MADDDGQACAYDTAVKLDSVGECTEQWAVYLAGLMHQDSQSVIKVVRYLRFVCSKTVKAGEEQQQGVGSADN